MLLCSEGSPLSNVKLLERLVVEALLVEELSLETVEVGGRAGGVEADCGRRSRLRASVCSTLPEDV